MDSQISQDLKRQVDLWIDGVSYEAAFWQGYLSNKKNLRHICEKVKTDRNIRLTGLEPGDLCFDKDKADDFTILDVGCGMVYANGCCIDGTAADMRYVDPLAGIYNEISDKMNADLPAVEFGMIEYLSSFYPEQNASLIIVQNALDHCFDPVKGVMECMKTLRKGGVLYLFHRKNEAEFENYRGFHQHNIDIRSGSLVIWNKNKETDINSLLEDLADVRIIDLGEHVAAVIKKTGEMQKIECAGDIRNVCCQLMYVIKRIMSFRFCFGYNLRYIFQVISHKISGQLSDSFKSALKRNIGGDR